jgi:NAD(P)H-flavin reductase
MLRAHQLEICESRTINELHWVAFRAPQLAAHWQPGQFMQIRCDDTNSQQRLLVRSLFAAQVDAKVGRIGFLYAPHSDDGLRWLSEQPMGKSIAVYGPYGKLPHPLAPRGTALCIGQTEGALRLLGVVNALQQQATATTFIAGDMTAQWHIAPQLVPTDVEYMAGSENVLRIAEKRLPDLIRWADHIYVAASNPVVSALRHIIRQTRLRAGKSLTAVCITQPMPCASQSCQQCRVQTRNGPRLACQVGPWFDMQQLL